MTPLSLLPSFLALAQVIFWDQGSETAGDLQKNGIRTIAVPPERAPLWQQAGITVVTLSPEDRKGRVQLDPPGVNRQITVASPTQRPWIEANGWQFLRQRGGKYFYDLPAGKGPLATAEAYVFGVDAILKIEARDLENVARLLRLFATVPVKPWPDVAQIEVVDDQSELLGDVMNLLSRRNLLWRPHPEKTTPAPRAAWLPPRLTVRIGTPAYSQQAAKDPSELASQIRRKIGDGQRVLRLFGSEAILCRFQAEGGGARLSLVNYGGGVKEGIRVRLRGNYPRATAITDRVAAAAALDQVRAGGATELTVPPFALIAVVDLEK